MFEKHIWHKEREKRNIRKKCGCELSLLETVERNVLKWFGHVERIGEERLVRECIGQIWRVTLREGDHIEMEG